MADNKTDLVQFDVSREALTQMFESLVSCVAVQMELEETELPSQAAIEIFKNASIETREQIANLLLSQLHQAKWIREGVKRAEARARWYEKFVDCFLGSLKDYMLDAGIKRIENVTNAFALRKNPTKLVVYNEDLVPEEYWKEVKTRELDKDMLTADLTAKKEIPGCRLETENYSVNIK